MGIIFQGSLLTITSRCTLKLNFYSHSVCKCDGAGSESNICDITSGVCRCKLNTEGDRCDKCKSGTFNLDAGNAQGCQSCFGYGHGTKCSSAQGFISANISTDFTGMCS